MINIPTEYKWVKIKVQKGWGRMNARYIVRTKTIILYDNWFTFNKIKREQILQHEYTHHIWYKIPYLYKKIWALISNWSLCKLLYIFWIANNSKNAYISKYAEKNNVEDFAETISIWILSNKRQVNYWSFVDTKIKLAVPLYNYYDNLWINLKLW